MKMRNLFKVILTAAVIFAPLAVAHAQTAEITYYTISSSDPDANNLAFGTYNNEVQASLGPDGLPVLNTAEYGCTSDCYTRFGAPGTPLDGSATANDGQVNASGEILYWSTSNPYVTQTLQTTTSLPFSVPSNFFPPNGTGTQDGGSSGFQSALISASLVVPAATTETLSFNIGADDMAFAYLDGQVVCDLGGVHGSTAGTCTTADVSTGTYSLEIFFVDINTSQAGLTFGINTEGITTTPPPPPATGVPEPGTFSMLGLGLAGLGLAKRLIAS